MGQISEAFQAMDLYAACAVLGLVVAHVRYPAGRAGATLLLNAQSGWGFLFCCLHGAPPGW